MFFSIENGSPKRSFVAAWGGARLDENNGFRTDVAQQGSTDMNSMKVRNVSEPVKFIGPGEYGSNCMFDEIKTGMNQISLDSIYAFLVLLFMVRLCIDL